MRCFDNGKITEQSCRGCEITQECCELYPIMKARREGRLKIQPEPVAGTCGSCENFARIPGTRAGRCKIQKFYRNRYGEDEPWRGEYEPSQSKKACLKYEARKGENGDA